MPKITLLRLGRLLRERRGYRGIREVAAEMEVSPATLSRVERGNVPDLATFSKSCKWLEVDPAEVLGLQKPGHRETGEEGGQRPTVIAAHLRADKTMDAEAAQDLAELILAAQRALAQGSARS